MENVKVNSERWLSLENLEGEVWKPVVGYEAYYSISNYGRLRSNTRRTKSTDGRNTLHYGKIVKLSTNKGGYLDFRISIEGRLISVVIHRLVAMAFIPNPENLPMVNHKDENPANNCAHNLEWCTNVYNINYKDTQKRHSESLRKVLRDRTYKVHQYSLDGNLIATYRGKKEIVDAGFSYDAVVHCCKHITNTACGYIWRRDNDPFNSKFN